VRKLFYTFILCLIASIVFGADTDYYVKQTATGTEDGKSAANAWGVSEFNSTANWSAADDADKIDPGDTVYFSGSFTTTITPPTGYGGSAGKYITLDGYEAGDCDQMNGSADANGASIDTSSGYGIDLTDNHGYFKIQDFTITGIPTAGIGSYNSGAGRKITNIIISRVAITESVDGIKMTAVNTNHSYGGGAYITIQDCLLMNIGEDDCSSARGAIRCFGIDDFIIRRNHIYNESDVTLCVNGQDGIVILTCDRVLIEYNSIYHMSENCIDNKDDVDVAYGPIIIRFNYFGDTLESAVSLSDINGNHGYVYGNLFDGTKGGGIKTNALYIFTGYEDVYVWGNVVQDADKGGIAMYNQDAARPVDNGHFYNNTVVHNRIVSTSIEHGGIELRDRTSGTYHVKNNIMVDNAINDSDYDQLYTGASAGDYTTADYNLYWTTANAPKINWNHSDVYTLTDPVSGTTFYSTTGQGEHSRVVDPLFTDYAPAGNRDFRLTSSSPAIGIGVDVSECFGITIQGEVKTICYEDLLNPNTTDFSTIPPTVYTAKATTYGWPMGAWLYQGELLKITSANPANEAVDVPITRDMTWSNPESAVTVDIYFDEDEVSCPPETPTKVVDDGDVETYDPGTMGYEKLCCWRVDVNHAGGTETGDDYEFTTTDGPPITPANLTGAVYHLGGAKIYYHSAGVSIEPPL